MKVLCISGKARHGKDTTAGILHNALEGDGFKVLVTPYADLLKYICAQFFEWNGAKDEVGRTILQRVGTDVIRQKSEDFWVNFIASILTFFPDEWDYVIIPDCRFPNEIDRLKEYGFDVTHIRVVRTNFQSPLTPEQQQHPSETALDGTSPDVLIENDGTLRDLERKLEQFVVDITGFCQMSINQF